MDRRIEKTRRSLQDALFTLIQQKPYDAIEIKDIAEQADTARVTFYRHYGTKEELLADSLARVYADMKAALSQITIEQVLDLTQPPPTLALFRLLDAQTPLYRALMTGPMSFALQQQVRSYIVQEVVRTASPTAYMLNVPVGLVAQHIAACVTGHAAWWVMENKPQPVEYIARVTHWMSILGVFAMIGRLDLLTLPPPDAWRRPE